MAANPFGAHWAGAYMPAAWPNDMRLRHDVVGRAGAEMITLHRHARAKASCACYYECARV